MLYAFTSDHCESYVGFFRVALQCSELQGRGEEGREEEQQIVDMLEENNITNYNLTDIEELFQYLTNTDSGCSNSSVYSDMRE